MNIKDKDVQSTVWCSNSDNREQEREMKGKRSGGRGGGGEYTEE